MDILPSSSSLQSPGKVYLHGALAYVSAWAPPYTKRNEAPALLYARRMEAPSLYHVADFTEAPKPQMYGAAWALPYAKAPC